MQKFTTLKGIAAPLPFANIDTDKIIPKQFLKTIKRTGLGVHLFDEMRYNDDGSEKSDFVLNKKAYRNATTLISGENFGCGSSREHAPWALLDFGIRCVIAPSFADIFYNNCFKNGILPLKLPKEQVDQLMQAAEGGQEITIDLPEQKIRYGNHELTFDIEEFRKHCLLNGLDDISLTLESKESINTFEQKQKESQPWLYTENG